MGDQVLNVKQIGNYPAATAVAPTDLFLMQQGGLGGPYLSVTAPTIFNTALVLGGGISLAPDALIAWNGASLTFDTTTSPPQFEFSDPVHVPSLAASGNIFVAGSPVLTQASFAGDLVTTWNGRAGDIVQSTDDILLAGGAPIDSPHFIGFVTAPTPWDFRAASDQVATTQWVQTVVNQLLCTSIVTSFNGRGGDIWLTTADINAAYAASVAPIWPTAPNPALGDASSRIATTLFVDESLADLQLQLVDFIDAGGGANLSGYAPLASPNFTGIPTAPTAAPGSSTGQLATTAFVHAAVTASTTGVASFNTRTGAVVLTTADVTAAGGAPIVSPTFTGVPQAPTPAPGDNTTKVATTAYVMAQLAAGTVTSFNTRTGPVTLTGADLTAAGGALLASPGLTGIPLSPTAAPGTNTAQIATTAFVSAAVAASTAGVSSFNGRTGAVTFIQNDISAAGGALLAGPTFTGVPAGPTAAPATATTQLATTAFVTAAITAAGGVTTFNGRSGAITLTAGDITGAGGAPLAGPAFTGVPTGPTAAPGTNTTQLATTAFVLAQGGVTTFNGRSGAVALTLADVTGIGGAPLASPVFTGTPTAPTQPQTDNSTDLATTAFVHAAVNAGVTSFNGRTGVVTFQANDVSAVGGALLAGPTFTGVPAAPTAAPGTSTTQLATTAFVAAALATTGGVTSFNGRAGAVTLQASDVTGVGGALLASPTFTGTPAAPTAAPGTSTTQLATTQFVRVGVTDGSNAAAGQVGEYQTASLGSASAVVVTNSIAANVVAVSLSPGDWEVTGLVGYTPAAATITALSAYTSAISGALPTSDSVFSPPVLAGGGTIVPTPVDRFNVSVTTSVYLMAYAAFSAGTLKAYGQISARRMR